MDNKWIDKEAANIRRGIGMRTFYAKRLINLKCSSLLKAINYRYQLKRELVNRSGEGVRSD